MRKSGSRNAFLTICIAPATILFFIFMIVPTFNVFRMSLYEKERFEKCFFNNMYCAGNNSVLSFYDCADLERISYVVI